MANITEIRKLKKQIEKEVKKDTTEGYKKAAKLQKKLEALQKDEKRFTGRM